MLTPSSSRCSRRPPACPRCRLRCPLQVAGPWTAAAAPAETPGLQAGVVATTAAAQLAVMRGQQAGLGEPWTGVEAPAARRGRREGGPWTGVEGPAEKRGRREGAAAAGTAAAQPAWTAPRGPSRRGASSAVMRDSWGRQAPAAAAAVARRVRGAPAALAPPARCAVLRPLSSSAAAAGTRRSSLKRLGPPSTARSRSDSGSCWVVRGHRAFLR
mmetsp:Transcript_12174/g.24281  ORF Transcript_12174/g.24281 Transcript_12174/m.24281 type:complete len:214 (-) Transcript_12174:463-1104(-)